LYRNDNNIIQIKVPMNIFKFQKMEVSDKTTTNDDNKPICFVAVGLAASKGE